MRAKNLVKKICECCGKEFLASRCSVRYCSPNCNKNAYKITLRNKITKENEATFEKSKVKKVLTDLSKKEYLTITEAASLLSLSRWTVYRKVVDLTIPAKRISKRVTLIRRKDIELFFERIENYKVVPNKERTIIDSWYTIADITEKYGLLRHRIRKIINHEGIATKKEGTRTLIDKNKIDTYFKKKGFESSISNLADWVTVSEIVDNYKMTEMSVYTFVSEYNIPRKRSNGKLYYSKHHLDILKNKGK